MKRKNTPMDKIHHHKPLCYTNLQGLLSYTDLRGKKNKFKDTSLQLITKAIQSWNAFFSNILSMTMKLSL